MRLLVDEDSEGKLLLLLLRDHQNDVLTVTEAGLASHSDAQVMELARKECRVVLTRNAADYAALHDVDQNHSGILVEYQHRDPRKNLSAADIVRAIGNIETAMPDLIGQFPAVNAWVY